MLSQPARADAVGNRARAAVASCPARRGRETALKSLKALVFVAHIAVRLSSAGSYLANVGVAAAPCQRRSKIIYILHVQQAALRFVVGKPLMPHSIHGDQQSSGPTGAVQRLSGHR
jgi:hypothetical protein